MKDKKSIAIVVLAAITAGVGIYSIVNNQSKLDAYTNLENQHDTVIGERTKVTSELQAVKAARDALDNETLQLKGDLSTSEKSVQTLGKEKVTLEETITAIGQKHAEELRKKDNDLKKIGAGLIARASELEQVSKDLIGVKAELEEKKNAFTELKSKTDEVIEEGKKAITELESKYDGLNQEKGALETRIAVLNEDIEETNKKLETSEGDRIFLERELLRLQDEKAKLVKKMNDIEFISAQYKRMKSDINIARRLDWMRRGIGHYAGRKTITEEYADLRRPKNGNALAGNSKTVAGNSEPLPDKIQVELTSSGEVTINGKIVAPKEAGETPEQPEVDAPVPTPALSQD